MPVTISVCVWYEESTFAFFILLPTPLNCCQNRLWLNANITVLAEDMELHGRLLSRIRVKYLFMCSMKKGFNVFLPSFFLGMSCISECLVD